MESAFGVDHGEIEKARRRRPQPTPPSYKPAAAKLKALGNRVANAPISLNSVGNTAGKGVTAVGTGLRRFPAATGAVVLGGGGYALYKNPPGEKKKRKPE